MKKYRLSDYKPPDFLIPNIFLDFNLDEHKTDVHARFEVIRNNPKVSDLVLDGINLVLISVTLNGKKLEPNEYQQTQEQLIISIEGDRAELVFHTQIHPIENKALTGLYYSRGVLTTQCEAQGFRRITYFLDRPDVLSVYTTTLTADAHRYSTLLSNGNLIQKHLTQDRLQVCWHDPFPKPCYLFATVAGQLNYLEDHFETCSGKKVNLRIFSQSDIQGCRYAMVALKQAMRWDEQHYRRQYDLENYALVAISDFNMGAMENKGLNIFNEQCVFSDPQATTDAEYETVLSVVAHEYFHNWTGNRVTCRDWFQLSLKEGLTVFREHEFIADFTSMLSRIDQVKYLRAGQFKEDSGPLAHPVQPQEYIEIDNFYTQTVYEKGAEVIRMLQLILSFESFHRGMDLYFSRHDGQAVTIEDFLRAMEDADRTDLTQFRRWYHQAGTPILTVQQRYVPETQKYLLTIHQKIQSTPGQSDKKPMVIPIKMGLLTQEGLSLGLKFSNEAVSVDDRVLQLTQSTETFEFVEIPSKPIPSLLRGFSAPVKLEVDYDLDELVVLVRYDTDVFNRWEASQKLASVLLLSDIESAQTQPEVLTRLTSLYGELLNAALDSGLLAELITLPTQDHLGEQMQWIDVAAIHQVHCRWRLNIAQQLRDQLLSTYHANLSEQYVYTPAQVSKRRLKNICLYYLMALSDPKIQDLCLLQYEQSDNMTDRLHALKLLLNSGYQDEICLDDFYHRASNHPSILNKWLFVQASCERSDALDRVKQLLNHRCYDEKNPNNVRALVYAFCTKNPVQFHRADGLGYQFLVDQILKIDQFNPHLSAQLIRPLTQWKRYIKKQSCLMHEQLKFLIGQQLSKNLFEIVDKSLQ